MAPPDTYPIQRAEAKLDLKTFTPPWPPSDLTPDEWIARFASLPLLHQPGAGWRYTGGAQVAGVLIERVARAPIADVLRERVFDPLGMVDTGFHVPADELDRFMTRMRPTTKPASCSCSTGPTAGGRSLRRCPTAGAGWSRRRTTCGRSPR
jgi:CubicO group peptidase (beta-lactamase class C family)